MRPIREGEGEKDAGKECKKESDIDAAEWRLRLTWSIILELLTAEGPIEISPNLPHLRASLTRRGVGT